MRKGIIYVVVTCAMPLLMTGCKKNTMSNIAATTETVSSGPDAVVSDTTKQEGFWVVSDKNGIFSATGIELNIPKDATAVLYEYLSGEKNAKVMYVSADREWLYRAVETNDPFKEISSQDYNWDTEEEMDVAGMHGVCRDYTTDEGVIWTLEWYDGYTGVRYSLSVFGETEENLIGISMLSTAESLYVPEQPGTWTN